MKTASLGYAKLDSSSPIKLRAPGRYLPIIVVPGFMGSRLTDPVTKKLAWNPTGFPMSALTGDTPGPFVCDYERIQQVTSDLVPDDLFPDESQAARDAVAHIRNFSQIIPPYYGNLAKALAETDYIQANKDAQPLGVKPRVYCFGYDWRQDNAKSAVRLAALVDDALRETGEDKCMLVVHSNGGLVARHFCRALGGESKVFAVFSIASPMLGAPSAYTQLKHGAPGTYVKEYFQPDADDPGGVIADNAISEGASIISAVASIPSSGVKNSLIGLLGPVWLVLTLGAGRLLTRRETVYFARHVQAAYQLLPGALFCNEHKNWNFFDPLNTALPPSGYLIKLPTLMDATIAAAGAVANAFDSKSHKAGDALTAAANQALHSDADDRSNALLEGANSESIEEMVTSMIALAKAGSSGLSDPATISRLKARILTLVDRFTKSFMDCRNNRALYSDIFTGLMDSVALRGISAYNLELAYRFDDGLTVQPRDEPVLSAASMLGSAVGGVISLISSLSPETDPQKIADKATKDAKDKLDAERSKPKAYVHPRTISYACTDVPVDGGCVLACLDVHSNYDSNFVKWQMIPNLLGLVMPSPSSSSDQSAIYYGDGTVPFFSASPPDALLSSPLLPQSSKFTGIMHTDMSADPKVLDKVKEHLADLIPTWYSGAQ